MPKRKVMRKDKASFIDVECASPEKYYGVTCIGGKAFITRNSYNSGFYRVISIDSVTRGNGWDGTETDLSTVLDYYISRGAAIWEFDTGQELAAWLAE